MPYLEEYDIIVCSSCVEFLANGEVEDDEHYDVEAIERHWPGEAGWRIHYDIEEGLNFSTLPCDCCGETLAGSRTTGRAWRQQLYDIEKLALAGTRRQTMLHTPDEVCFYLQDNGFQECSRGSTDELDFWKWVRKFEGPCLAGPNCALNGTLPCLTAKVYGPSHEHDLPGSVMFSIYGQRSDGISMVVELYTIPFEKVPAMLPGLHLTASRVWQAFFPIPEDLEVLAAAQEASC